ncbi:cytochrome P450 [Cubamyces menziesii]|nr:cytochrome P450 [Cubamyces menziesii]
MGLAEALCVLLILSVSYILALSWKRRSHASTLPPGPRGIPILGNVCDIPRDQPWVAFSNLSRKYGDVISFSILGQTTIVLNSASAVSDLLDKRSAIYSSRPDPMVDVSRATGWCWSFAGMPSNDDWRLHRRLFSRFFQPSTVEQWHAVQTREAHRMLEGLLEDHADVSYIARLSFCRSLLNVAYGLPARDVGQRFVTLLSDVDASVTESFGPAAMILPWLRRIPRWCPGGGWQRKLGAWRRMSRKTLDEPFNAAQDAMSRGAADPSILSNLLDRGEDGTEFEISEEVIKGVIGLVFIAGTGFHGTVETFLALFCAMLRHPDAQKRAQDELDAIVGADRLPHLSDKPSLPYVNALVKELLRWHNVLPFCLPHSTTQDDEYRGWRIPSGVTVLINSWSILHDPKLYRDPEEFNPDRFLKDGKINPEVFDPATVAFGAGRRICPGRHFAEDSLFINVASVLHAFSIVPAVDERGEPIPVEHKVSTGLVSVVEPFNYSIQPRFAAVEALIRNSIVD